MVIVGIHSVETVESYKRKPITTMNERIQVIQSCKYISLIVPNAPLIITKEYLDKYNIDMVFHGHSPEEDIIYNKMYEIPFKLGKFTRTEYTKGISTSNIIDRIITRKDINI